jgi:hypothetical protein
VAHVVIGVDQDAEVDAVARGVADEVIFNEKQNEVVFIKYISPTEQPGMPDPTNQD